MTRIAAEHVGARRIPALPGLLREILRLSPKGRRIAQLASRLGEAGLRVDVAQLAHALEDLRRDGVVRIGSERRWQLAAFHRAAPIQAHSLAAEASSALDGRLFAVAAYAAPASALPDGPAEAGRNPAEVPSSLLAYYAATQRLDARGAVKQFPDVHGLQFQLIAPDGRWWTPDDEVSIPLDSLPAQFREALERRGDGPAAIGWPLASASIDGLQAIVPVAMVAVELTRAADRLRLRPSFDAPSLNPDWIRLAARAQVWTADLIVDRIAAQSLDELGRRVAEGFASLVDGRLNPARPDWSMAAGGGRLCNTAALFLSSDKSFTTGAAHDLQTLSEAPYESIADTALGFALTGAGAAPPPIPVAAPFALTGDQFAAVRNGLSARLSVVTGPPGSGKSQTIVSLIASALLDGRSVLFASRNHQALDAVEDRLAALSPDTPFVVRARDRDGTRDTDFVRVLQEILTENPIAPPQGLDAGLRGIADQVALRDAALDAHEARADLNMLLAEAMERHAVMRATDPDAPPPLRSAWWRAALQWLFGARRPVAPSAAELPPSGATLRELDAAVAAIVAALAAITGDGDVAALDEAIRREAEIWVPQVVAAGRAPSDNDRRTVAARLSGLALARTVKARSLPLDLSRKVLAHRPVWACTSLSVPSRMPLAPGMFDLVIFDEAGQADVASALPLMARAHRAVVVGDPQQLATIPTLGADQERALALAHSLDLKQMGRYAQSVNSLFTFADMCPGAGRRTLSDQFRSAPAIVSYLNDAFYAGRLRPAREDAEFTAPTGFKPGLAWTDVQGRTTRDDAGQPCNLTEARAIADHLHLLLVEPAYAGTIGVLTPFNGQARLITRLCAGLPEAARDAARLRISTIDGFQGDERDVILFSPVAAPGAESGTLSFLARDRRRYNVAISRARALAHVMGDLNFARKSGIEPLRRLAAHATEPRSSGGETVFDSGWERKMCAALVARGLKPQPQFPVAGRRLDFALFGATGVTGLPGVKLDLEVDGARWHLDLDGRRKSADLWRDHQLKGLGWRVRRFWVHELERDMEACLDTVERDLV
jgi:very-short-patch-repair endonuclease